MIKALVLGTIISMTSSTDVLSFLSVIVTAGLGLAGVIYTQRSTRLLTEKEAARQREEKRKEREKTQAVAQATTARNDAHVTSEMLIREENRRLIAENRVLQLERYIRANELTVPPEDH